MITNLENIVRYAVSGSSYAITYPYWAIEEIKAYITLPDGTVSGLTYGTDFTVTTPNGVNGTLNKVSAWTDAEKLTIVREVELTQEIDLINGEKIDGEQLETGLDLKTAGLQQLNEKFTRSVMTSIDETGDNMVIPNSTARRGAGDGTLLGFDGTGGNIVLRDLKQFDADVANTAANVSLAEAAKNKANEWAEKNTEVESGQYSAKHWAAQAMTSATSASNSATTSQQRAEDSESWAVGTRDGSPVSPIDPTYHNSSKYYHDIITQIISGALRYQGTWTTTGQTDYSGISTPRLKGDMFYCQGTATTIDGVTYTQGDLIIFNTDVAQGTTIITSMIDKIDNTETVTPDNTCTLTNKTIAFGSNTMTDVASTNTAQTLTNKTISYADNTLTGVQPTLTAGTGIDITGTTISAKQTYSTSEVKTGDVWIDGKPIYRKAFSYSNLVAPASATTIFQMIAISDVDTIIAADGFTYQYIGGVNNGALPVTHHNLPYTSSVVFYSGGYLSMSFNEAGGDTRNLTGSIWVEYTKTSD